MPAPREVIPLTAVTIQTNSPEFSTIAKWPFEDSFVQRLLRDDIPIRALFGNCRVFLYHDPKGQPVGFGTLDVCGDYSQIVGDTLHPYIPLLGVNPTIKSLGYGTSIVRHLIGEAAILPCVRCGADILLLDVYTTSLRARALYDRELFRPITDEIYDPVENKNYIVMARRVSTAPALWSSSSS
jgi:GNAT superfamily N-acetyltransferase